MVLLTVPIFFPVAQALGFDPIWFGVIIVLWADVALLILLMVFPDLVLVLPRSMK